MKKLFVAVLALVSAAAMPSGAAAQITLGLHAGPTWSRISTADDEVRMENRQGINAGVSLTVPLSGAFSLRPGLLYRSAGSEATTMIEQVSVSAVAELAYLDFGVLGRLDVPIAGRAVSAYVLFGPSVGYNLSCEAAIIIDGTRAGGDCGTTMDNGPSVEGSVPDFDVGLSLGWGVSLALSRSLRLGAEVVYTRGLSNIGDADDPSRNRGIMALAGFEFTLGS
ncbi:porin family protein [Candidatus Palauibacter sp.]|uniref:porin family protein n=1 Tax=Candidatus Palauibacter sp. TaxID=3101350 RepID=UPI003B02C64D